MVKKSYNPFKMWGSYVGTGIITIPVILIFLFVYAFEEGHGGYSIQPLRMLIFIGIIIVGFLIGWLIHALIRRIRK